MGNEARKGWPDSGEGVPDYEGQGARELQELKAHLMKGLGGARDGRRRLVGDGADRDGGVNGGEGVPAG